MVSWCFDIAEWFTYSLTVTHSPIQVLTMHRRESNPRALDRKSDAIPLRHQAACHFNVTLLVAQYSGVRNINIELPIAFLFARVVITIYVVLYLLSCTVSSYCW